ALRRQQMIKADFAELIDDHRSFGHRWIAQRPIEQRRLAAAEKAGEDGDGRVGHVLRYNRVVASLRANGPDERLREAIGDASGSWIAAPPSLLPMTSKHLATRQPARNEPVRREVGDDLTAVLGNDDFLFDARGAGAVFGALPGLECENHA